MNTTLVICVVIGLVLLAAKLISWRVHFSRKNKIQDEIESSRVQTEQSIEADGRAATLCVYRMPKFAGKLNLHSIFCDNTPIALLKNGSYAVCEVAPGQHEISTPASPSPITLNFRSGEEYFIRTGVTGLTGYVFEIVSRECGKSEIAKLSRV